MKGNSNFKISEYIQRRNVKRFSIFLSMAFLFLVISKLSNDYNQSIKLKIQLTNVDDEIIIVNDSLNYLDAVVQAKGFSLVPFLFKDYKLILIDADKDVSTFQNLYLFDVRRHKFLIERQLSKSYKILSLKPDSLFVTYTKRASKFVPVVLNKDIEFSPGYDIFGTHQLNVDSVKIVGSENNIREVSRVVTEELRLSDVKNTINQTLRIEKIPDIDIFPKQVNVSAEVMKFTEGTIESSIAIVNKPSELEINYFPKNVTISYYVDLDNFKSVQASDFKVECDFALLEEGQSFFIPKVVKKPDFVKRVVLKQKRIDFIKL